MANGIDFASLSRQGQATPVRNMADPKQQLANVRTATLGAEAEPDISQNANITPEEHEKNRASWKSALRDPRVRAGFIQMGLNLMAGQNIGQAMGGGFAATGRAETLRQEGIEAARKADLEERAMALREAQASGRTRRSGGGGGGGGSSRTTRVAGLKFTDFNKMIEDHLDAVNTAGALDPNFTPTTMDPGKRMTVYGMMGQMEEAGVPAGEFLSLYLNDEAAAMAGYNAVMGGGEVPSPEGGEGGDTTASPAVDENGAPLTSPTPTPRRTPRAEGVSEEQFELFGNQRAEEVAPAPGPAPAPTPTGPVGGIPTPGAAGDIADAEAAALADPSPVYPRTAISEPTLFPKVTPEVAKQYPQAPKVAELASLGADLAVIYEHLTDVEGMQNEDVLLLLGALGLL